jgi:hypothetical protein
MDFEILDEHPVADRRQAWACLWTSSEFARPGKGVCVAPLFRPESKIQNPKSKTSISSRTEGMGKKPFTFAADPRNWQGRPEQARTPSSW